MDQNDYRYTDQDIDHEENENETMLDNQEEKRERVFVISETTYKILCMADNKNYDPTTGLENIAMMYLSLAGPIDFDQLELERAKAKARKLDLIRPVSCK